MAAEMFAASPPRHRNGSTGERIGVRCNVSSSPAPPPNWPSANCDSPPFFACIIVVMVELTPDNATGYLRERGWIGPGPVRIEPLGGGVSNVVLRVETPERLFVVKQSRP